MPRRFDERRSEMLHIYGTPVQFADLMQDNLRRGWATQEQVDEAIRVYKLEWETAVETAYWRGMISSMPAMSCCRPRGSMACGEVIMNG